MTRNGKIARLPAAIREQLNQRLLEGEPGKPLVEWLNGLPRVRALLAAQFQGQPIVAQNLSRWKQGGYEEWEEEPRETKASQRDPWDPLSLSFPPITAQFRLKPPITAFKK